MNLSMPSVKTYKSKRGPRVVLVKAFGHTFMCNIVTEEPYFDKKMPGYKEHQKAYWKESWPKR